MIGSRCMRSTMISKSSATRIKMVGVLKQHEDRLIPRERLELVD